MNKIFIQLIGLVKRVIRRWDEMYNLAACNKQVNNRGSIFSAEAVVVNMQNDVSKISIGKGSHIRGELITFPYGGQISIGDNCYVGERTKIWSGDSITIGSNVLISHNVNIIDTNTHETNHLERAVSYSNLLKIGHPKVKGSLLTSPITIEDYVWINFNVTILKGVKIGKGAIIASDTVILNDVPPFVLMGGNPARIIKYLEN